MTRREFMEELALLLEHPVDELAPDERLAHIAGWDSTAAIGVIALLEGAVGVEVHHEQVAECSTVADVLKLAQGKLD